MYVPGSLQLTGACSEQLVQTATTSDQSAFFVALCGISCLTSACEIITHGCLLDCAFVCYKHLRTCHQGLGV